MIEENTKTLRTYRDKCNEHFLHESQAIDIYAAQINSIEP